MKKTAASFIVFLICLCRVFAGWSTTPASSVSINTTVSVGAGGQANGGYAVSYLVIWAQSPSGSWYPAAVGTGVNGANISCSGSKTLDASGTWNWTVRIQTSGPSGSPSGTQVASATTTVGPTATTFSFSNLNFTYDGSTKTASVTPSPAGATYTADLTKGPGAGAYTVSATANGDYSGSNSATLYIDKANQPSLGLSASTSQSYSTSQTLSASGGSGGGSLSYAIVGQSTGGNATLSGAVLTANASSGWVDVQASRAADSNYNIAYSSAIRVYLTTAATSFGFSNLTYTYDGSAKTASVTPSPAGATYTSDLTKGPLAGTYTVSAAANGNYSGTGSATLTINKAGQTIAFGNPGAQTYGGSLALGATASSGLAVSYVVNSGPASLSGNTLNFTGVGSVTVTASQAGNANYNAAGDVAQTFTVNKASQSISFSNPGTQTYGASFALGATASSGLAVSYVVSSGPATLSGNVVTITGVGSITITASQAGNANYNAATNAGQTFSVNKATPSGAFSARTLVAAISSSYTVVAGDLNAAFTGPSGVTAPSGSISYSIVGPGTAVTAGTILPPATYTVRASYPGDANFNATTKDTTWVVTNDSDGDSVPDYVEAQLGTNPSVARQSDSSNQAQMKIHKPN